MTTPAHTISRNYLRFYQANDGREFISVTSLMRATMADAAPLVRWKQKRLAEIAIAEVVAAGLDTPTDEIVKAAIDRSYESGPEAQLGTAVHDAIDRYEREQTKVEDLKLAAYLARWIDLKADHELEVIDTEVTLVNTTHNYSGTTDGRVRASIHPYRNDRFLYDIKTGKGVYDSYALQLALLSRCDSMLTPEGDVVKIPEELKVNAQIGLIAKLGPRSFHLHKVDIHKAWKYAKNLIEMLEWHRGAGQATISESLPGLSRKAEVRAMEERRRELLDRARGLDAEARVAVKSSWGDAWPKLTDPGPQWDDETLDDVETLIANAERGGLA